MHCFIRNGLTTLLVTISAMCCAQTSKERMLQSRIRAVIDTSHAKIGVGILGLDFNDSLTVNGSEHFPMQSVFKFPLAICVLSQVDAGKLSLRQKIILHRKDLDTDTWSPMLKAFRGADTSLSVADLLRYSVSKSDNNACDILFRLVGGTATVDRLMHRIGINNISVKATEAQMKTAWPVQYTNWCEPSGMLKLLRLFYNGSLLSKSSNQLLMKIMLETDAGPNRIKGHLPAGTSVAHKTGTSDENEKGHRAATNDVGIITLPDGRHYALAVFVSDYYGSVSKGEHLIAVISRIVWDYFQVR